MIRLNPGSTALRIPRRRSGFIDNTIAVLAVIYTFVSFGLSGITGVSRLSFISAFAMAILLFIRLKRLQIPVWIVLIAGLYLYLIVLGMTPRDPAWDMMYGATTVLIGTVCIGLALVNGLYTPALLAYSMLGATLINVIAIVLGYDTTPYLDQLQVDLNRYSGLLGNSNTLAVNMLLSALTIWLFAPRYNVPVKLLSIVTAVYGVYVSGSRKGIILIGSLLLVVIVRLVEKLSRWKQIAILGASCFLAYSFYQYLDDVLDLLKLNVLAVNRIAQAFYGTEASFSQRKLMVEEGYTIWRELPIFGHGLGQFANLSGFGYYSHSNYIELLVSGGIVALLIYYALYPLIVYNAYTYHRKELFYAVVAVIAMLVVDTVAVSHYDRSTMLFIALIAFQYSPENGVRVAGKSGSGRQCV